MPSGRDDERAASGEVAVAVKAGLPAIGPKTWLGLAVLLTGAFVAMLDAFIVNVAVPSIRADLHASYAAGELVIVGYTLTYATGQVTGGRLGDTYGRRRLFTLGLAGFTLASALCAIAPSPAVLVVGRLLQGVAAALLSPQVLAIIRVTFPEGRPRARAFAVMGVVVGTASVLGQVLGGLVVEVNLWGLGWRAAFLINLPIGVAAVAATPLLVPESHAQQRARLDRSGVALSTVGLFLLVFPLIEGQQDGWPAWTLVMLVASGIILAVFIANQARKAARDRAPLLDTGLFAERAFSLGAAALFLFSATMPPLYLAFTVLAQTGYGASPVRAAFYFAPLALAFSVTSAAAGRFTRSDARPVLITGAALNVAGAGLAVVACLASPGGVPTILIPALVVIGAGEGLFLTPIFNAVLSSVGDHRVGAASGVLSTVQRLGNAVGLAVLDIPFLDVYHDLHTGGASQASAYTHAFAAISVTIAATCAFAAVLLVPLPPQSSSSRQGTCQTDTQELGSDSPRTTGAQ
jgi:EmrB/QacA subfamily drug resistance transporter